MAPNRQLRRALAFGLLTDLIAGFLSASGFVLLLQFSTFALPIIQGLPGDPLVVFAWSFVVAYLHTRSFLELPDTLNRRRAKRFHEKRQATKW